MQIHTVDDFDAALARGPYADGGYPVYFVTAYGCVLSFAVAIDEAEVIREALRGDLPDRQWHVVGVYVNWEDPELYCDFTNERIESAYAEELAHESE